MRLPGGLLRGGELKRRLRLREPDGELELLIAETPRRARSLQDGVSRVVSAVVEDLDGETLSYQSAHDLCVADRQFIMHRASALLGMAHQWIATSCAQCDAPFELEVDLDALPVGEAGAGFPFVTVETAAGPLQLRVPTGADQVAIGELIDAGGTDDSGAGDAERELLRRCVVDQDLPAALSADDLVRIEEALDQISPWVVTELEARCPECGTPRPVALDPYGVMRMSASLLLDDVHALASHYHWSEPEILALPRERRQLYLSRIDRARGLTS